jgi:hypothetical protein
MVYLMYEDEEDSLRLQSMSYAANQLLADSIKYWANWEIMSVPNKT